MRSCLALIKNGLEISILRIGRVESVPKCRHYICFTATKSRPAVLVPSTG
jgi:hypothetical protein